MLKAYILSDGSYDSNLRIGTCAYSVVFDGETHRDVQRIANISSSTEAEMFGVYCATRFLRQTMADKGLNAKLDEVFLFCDSEETFRLLRGEQKSLFSSFHHQQWKDRIHGNLINMTNSIFAHKVKSHVSNSKASNLEKKHNEIDVLARSELQAFRADVLRLDNEDSKICGVAINGNSKKSADKANYQIGYQLAHSGYKIRLYMGQVKEMTEHPFLRGVEDLCEKKGLNVDDIITWQKENPYEPCNFLSGCDGLDASLVQAALGIKKTGHFNNYENKFLRSASLSRLIFGHQREYPSKTKPENIKYVRDERGSEFVLNLSCDPLNQRVLGGIARLVDIDIYNEASALKLRLNQSRYIAEDSTLSPS